LLSRPNFPLAATRPLGRVAASSGEGRRGGERESEADLPELGELDRRARPSAGSGRADLPGQPDSRAAPGRWASPANAAQPLDQPAPLSIRPPGAG